VLAAILSKTGGNQPPGQKKIDYQGINHYCLNAFPTRDDFAAMLKTNHSVGEDQGFEGRVVKGTVNRIENDMAVIDV